MEGMKILVPRSNPDVTPEKPHRLPAPTVTVSAPVTPRYRVKKTQPLKPEEAFRFRRCETDLEKVRKPIQWVGDTPRFSDKGPDRFHRPTSSMERISSERFSQPLSDPLGFSCTKTQLMMERKVNEVCSEALRDYIPTVTRIGYKSGRKVMWTSLPKSIVQKYGIREMFTQDGWKQKSLGNRPIDISGYKVGDNVQMLVQSVGLGGKHPIVRGIPALEPRKREHSAIRLSGLAAMRKRRCYVPPALRAKMKESGLMTPSPRPSPSPAPTPRVTSEGLS